MAAIRRRCPRLIPLHDLITIDQLVAPDFTVTGAAAHVDATTLAAGDAALASALTRDGLQSAARVEYQRDVDFSTSNGPIDIVATVERFAGISGASAPTPPACDTSTRSRVRCRHRPVHSATRRTRSAWCAPRPARLQAVEITVVWRVRNLVNLMVARGRYGGTRLDDALVLAGLQTQNEFRPAPA